MTNKHIPKQTRPKQHQCFLFYIDMINDIFTTNPPKVWYRRTAVNLTDPINGEIGSLMWKQKESLMGTFRSLQYNKSENDETRRFGDRRGGFYR
jgi:hypothetical protein